MLKLILSAFKRMTTAISSPFRMLIVKVQRLFNINILTAKLITPLTKKVRSLLSLRPKSKEDYVSLGRFWIFRKVFLTLILICCAGVFLYFSMFAPKLPVQPPPQEALVTTVSFDYDDMDLSAFSGVANIRAADGLVVYTGDIDGGICKGVGTLYTREGKLLYAGAFDRNLYNGKGVQYYADGAVHYEGDFIDNLYEGSGKLYNAQGGMLYDGSFKGGLFEGEGKLYGETGQLLYEGSFSKGAYHGPGVSYAFDGAVRYTGEFFAGKPQGAGTLYSAAGKQLYTGPVYDGGINYRAWVNSTLAEVEEAFSETPKVYYDDRSSCFVFEQAGIIVTTDCRVKTDVWEPPTAPEDQGAGRFFLPDDGGASYSPQEDDVVIREAEPEEAEITQSLESGAAEVRTLAAFAGDGGRGRPRAAQVAWFIPDDASSSSPSSSSSRDEDATVEDLLDEVIDRMDSMSEESSAASSQAAASSSEESASGAVSGSESSSGAEGPDRKDEQTLPDFIKKNITLYFEIDKNVWQPEAELDKSKVIVNKVTVMRPDPLPDFGEGGAPYDDNLPPGIEDCVAIDFARQEMPTAFRNILFEMDKQNKLFIRLKNISYTERIVQKTYEREGMTFRCCYQMDDREKLMYYSIEM